MSESESDVQYTQSVAQLGLDMVALGSHRRLKGRSDKPIFGSYLARLDAHFKGHSLGNRGRVVEHTVFALPRV